MYDPGDDPRDDPVDDRPAIIACENYYTDDLYEKLMP